MRGGGEVVGDMVLPIHSFSEDAIVRCLNRQNVHHHGAAYRRCGRVGQAWLWSFCDGHGPDDILADVLVFTASHMPACPQCG